MLNSLYALTLSSPNTPRREGGLASAFHSQGKSGPERLQRVPEVGHTANKLQSKDGFKPRQCVSRVCF